MSLQPTYNGLEIAIIGMSAQFPESKDYRQFWQNLKDGRELIKVESDEKLKETGVSEAELRNELFIKFVPITDNKDCFDNSFFGYSAEEAALMDPQIRLFHEQCWKALEDAGYASLIEKNKIGLFAGASANDNWKIYAHGKLENSSIDPFYLKMITAPNFITTLVSYKLNLRGPSYFVDTACSTSLAAVHLACRSLITRDCAIALAGGISINTIKKKGYYYQEGMILSKDGHCRSFDSQATGTIPGEGAGVVVLKRLSEAIKDRDHIYAIIKATAANNDGNYKVGYTAPSVKGQAECIIAAQKLAGVDPRSISYVEAHGTGTKLGDPVEVRALNEAFGVNGDQKFCALGSVKTNMGHADAAAGVAGLIKTALSLKHKAIPPSLHFAQPNPEIDFKSGPFYVNAALKQWQRNGTALRAGVSSFGIGGTNVHAVLEEAPIPAQTDPGSRFKILPLSAKTPDALVRYSQELRNFLLKEPEIDLADLSYSLQLGRKAFAYRKSVVYSDKESLLQLLDPGKLHPLKTEDRNNSIVFMFPGQGTQYAGMGRDLYEQHSFVRELMDKGFALIRELTGEDFKSVLFSGEDNTINQTAYTQPIIFLLEYSLAQWLLSIGINPRYMIGHSIGEYVAACLSGVFSFEDAVRIVVKRGALMNSLPGGSMLSVPVSAAEAQPFLNNGISLAAVNGPEQIVLSGDHASAESLMEQLEQLGITFIKLHTSHAFHSAMQDSIMHEFKNELRKLQFHRPQKFFISNLTGDFIREEEAMSADYWVRHMRETVQFGVGIQNLLSRHKELVFIEAGVGKALSTLVKQHSGKNAANCLNLVRSIKETADDMQYLTERISELWSMGVAIDWEAYYRNEKRNRISLPAYCFEPVKYPAEVDPFAEGLVTGKTGSNKELKDWIYFPSWKRSVVLPSYKKMEGRKGYLFFSAANDISQSIGSVLRQHSEVVEVFMGEEYSKLSKTKYIIDPIRADHFHQLVNDIKWEGLAITDVVYGWGMAAKTPAMVMEAENLHINLAYFSLVKLVKALLQNEMLQDKRFAIITDCLHKLTGTEEPASAQSLLLGLVNVLPQEYGVPCCNIDVDLHDNSKGLADLIAWEISNNTGKEDRIVAYRGSARWIQEYQKNTIPLQTEEVPIRKGGIYLITGGLGNLGFVLAKHLVQQYGAKLMLAGRRSLSKRTNGTTANAEWLQRLEYLRSLSNDVHYFSTDVSDAAALESVVNKIENEVGKINGLIHAAGNIDPTHFELVEDITIAKALAMFEPKVKGIENIYNIFKHRPLDFVWITSSVATVLGGLSYGSYCSANAYMDHFVSSRCADLPNWKCIGLAEMAFTEQAISESRNALKPNEIISLFEWSVNLKGIPVIIETVEELEKRIRRMYHEKKETYLGDTQDSSTNHKAERPELSTTYVAPATETEQKVKEIFETFFCIDEIGVEDGFFELGGDSLKAMILLKRIKKEFNVSLTLNDFLLKTNIRDVSAKIDEVVWFRTDVKMENEITI